MKRPDDHVIAQVQELPTSYLTCRSYGHSWSPGLLEKDPSSTGSKLIVFRISPCGRCHATKKEVWRVRSARGYQYLEAMAAPRLTTPPPYRVTGMAQGASRQMAKSEGVRRALDEVVGFLTSDDSSNVVALRQKKA